MSLIEWRDDFSVGVPAIDHEHQEMIQLINRLGDMSDRGEDYAKVIDALAEIYAQISAHFALEEKIMRDAHYDHYPEHKDDHEILLDEIREIMELVEADGSYNKSELGSSLERWFSLHFQTHDARLHRKIV
jgi:hemerythrin